MACLLFVFQGTPSEAQHDSETQPSIIQPEVISLEGALRTVSGVYVCIEPCNLLTAYVPEKTIFHELAPDAIGTFDTLETTKATFLKQAIKTAPIGIARLSEKAMGKDARRYPGWLWKGLLITSGCSIMAYLISAILARRKRSDFSTVQLYFIFGPLVPFLLLLLAFGFMSIVLSSAADPMVDIYVDNATHNTYEIMFNREKVPLPPERHVCLRVRPREHDLRIREKGSGRETRFAVSADFHESETYLINLEGANRYQVEHKSYTIY